MTRYHPALVVLHWLIALMVIGLLFAGKVILDGMPNTDPAKVQLLMFHMAGGMAVLALMLLRIALRRGTTAPPPAPTGNALLDRAGPLAHLALYLLVIAMSLSGFALSLMAGLPDIVFGGSGAPLPVDFGVYWPRGLHGLLSGLLIALVLLHIAAAIWHQAVRKDRLLSRMWFGPRRG
jgi:cytochrome b561